MSEQERMQVLINDLKDLGFFEEVIHADDRKATLQEAALCLSMFLIDGELDSISKQDESLLDKDTMKAIEDGSLAKVMVHLFPQHVPD